MRAAAETFRANPKFDVDEAITELGVGEALVSTLEDDGVPGRPAHADPAARSRIGPATRRGAPQRDREPSPLAGRYDQPVDREFRL